ncbi:MAG: hypothetical protein NTW96_21930, partial [Planctomycetia bacterium]|nr:hypothetical protein [Planctomycetia bacterium]
PAKKEPAKKEPAKKEPTKTRPATTAPAKTEPAKTEPAEVAPKAPPKPRDPAVEAILATKPSTPDDLARAAEIMADLNEPELAKGFLKKVLEAKLDEEQLAALAQRFGSAMFTNLASRRELAPEAQALADAVLAAVKRQHRSPEHVAALIEQLEDPAENVQAEAMVGLRKAGEAAVAPLVAVLADANRKAEHVRVRAALAQLGSVATQPLVGCLESPDAALVAQVIDVLAEANARDMTMFLLAPLLSPESDPAVRAAAAAALGRLAGPLPSRAEAAAVLSDRAEEYFQQRRVLHQDADGQAVVWQWDPGAKQSVAKRYPPDVASVVIAARLAREALSILPDDETIRQRYLLTMLEQAAYASGLDAPLDMVAGTPAARAAEFGVEAVDAVLDRAMATGHMPAAAAAARILGRIGTAEKVLAGGAAPSPLARALRSADRRLRFAALEGIMNLQLVRPFAGSSYVPEALAFFAASRGSRRVMVAGPSTEESRYVGGFLIALGYEVDTGSSGRDLFRQLLASGDYELVLVDAAIQDPPIHLLIPQLRHDARTADLPVGIVAAAEDADRARRAAKDDRLTEAMVRPHDKEAVQWQVKRLAALAGHAAVSQKERQREAAEALVWLAELASEPHPVHNLQRAEGSVLAALGTPELGAQAVAVLEKLGTPASQKALVDLASLPARPLALRAAALAAFVASTEKHGILLRADEILAQYDRYNQSATADAATQQILGTILDCLEARGKANQPEKKG